MPLSNFALDTFVSQELSLLGACSAKPLRDEFADGAHWLQQFVLNSVFSAPCSPRGTQLAFAVIRRSSSSILAHDAGVDAVNQYLSGDKTKSRGVGVYFEALSHLEHALATLYQGLDVGARVTGQRLFEKSDESPASRLNQLYNLSKHYLPEQLPEGHPQALWLANDGLHCAKTSLSWDELADLLRDLAHAARRIAAGRYAEELSSQ